LSIAAPGALPLRPLTTGELLDAAVVLLRARARRLIVLGIALALAEQALLFPLRRFADVDSTFLPGTGRLAEFGILVVVSFATEAFAIAVLAGVAAGVGPQALLGRAAPPQPPARMAQAVVAAVPVALLCAGTAWWFLVLPPLWEVVGLVLSVLLTGLVWPFVYGLLGLTTPAVVIDGLGPLSALLRSIRLSGRIAGRAMWIQVLGYLAWLLIRLGLAIGTIALVSIAFSSPSPAVDNILMGGTWLIVNALAYPVLGCLAVVLHLETRMRTEGLDIALSRNLNRGTATEASLRLAAAAVPPVAGPAL
jgi:hypothetical protein